MDLIRHQSLFDPRNLAGGIAIAGVGALGSALALNLAKLGCPEIHLFDPDMVEPHNLPNQVLYGAADVDAYKVNAAAKTLAALTTGKAGAIYPWMQKLLYKEDLEPSVRYLFVCTDSMASRELIFRKCVWLNPQIRYFSEGRMNAREVTHTAFRPYQTEKCREYLDRLYPDEEVPVQRGTCGNILSIGATSAMLAATMTWHFMASVGLIGNSTVDLQYEELSYNASNLEVHHKGLLQRA